MCHVLLGDIAEGNHLRDQFGGGSIALKFCVFHDRQAIVAAQWNLLAVLSASVLVVENPAAGFLALS